MKDTYRTLLKASEPSLYKEKGSKFYGYAFPVLTEKEIEEFIAKVKTEHHKARHWCYAWQLGKTKDKFRANDDGEPSNSAGMPIYGQIESKDLTNVLVVVVRYFGGVKLGVGGLVRAYKTAAQLALDSCQIVTKTIDEVFLLDFKYEDMNRIQRVVKKYKVNIVSQKLEMTCQYEVSIRKSEIKQIIGALEDLRCVEITSEEDLQPG
jgi:uncharacterized YigZ family protein